MKTKLLAAVLGLMIIGSTTGAEASDKVRCEVLTIEASSTGQGIDPVLAPYASVLRKAPFSSFNTFKLVHKQPYQLDRGVPVPLVLPPPLLGTLGYNKEVQGRLDLTLTINRPEASPIVISGKATPGSPFFAAGLKSSQGRWVFGIICNQANGLASH